MNKTVILMLLLIGLVALPACGGDTAQEPEGDAAGSEVVGAEQTGESPIDSESLFDGQWWAGGVTNDKTFSSGGSNIWVGADQEYADYTDRVVSLNNNLYQGYTFDRLVGVCKANRRECVTSFRYYAEEIAKLTAPIVNSCPNINWPKLAELSASTSPTESVEASLEPQALSRPVRILISAGGTVAVGLGAVRVFEIDFDQAWQEWTTRAGLGALAYFSADFFGKFASADWGKEANKLSDTQLAAVVSGVYQYYIHVNEVIAPELTNAGFPGGIESMCPTQSVAETWIEMAELPQPR